MKKLTLFFSVLAPTEINQDCLRARCWSLHKLLIFMIELAICVERTKYLRIFTKRATINSLEKNPNYDKSLEMVILKKKRKLFKMLLCCLALLSQRNLIPLMLQPLYVKHQWHTGEAVTPQETQSVILWGAEYRGTWTNARFLKCAVEQVHFVEKWHKVHTLD